MIMARKTDADPIQALVGKLEAEDAYALLQQLLAAQHKGQTDESVSRLAAALEAQNAATERTVRKSNADHLHLGPFEYPEGGIKRPKPPLKYVTYVCGIRQREKELTPTEIELFNSFTVSKEIPKKRWHAIVDRDGTSPRLQIGFPARAADDLVGLPPLTVILSTLLYGEEVADPSRAAQRIADLERQMKELLAAQSASDVAPVTPEVGKEPVA
jgi:hypothetical protein